MATWPTVTDDDGTGTTGTILDQALFNSMRDYVGVAWQSVAYAAGNFTASTGSWTVDSGDQIAFKYIEHGRTMILAFDIRSTDVSATPSELRVAVPNGRTIQSQSRGAFFGVDAGTDFLGLWQAAPSGVYIQFYRNSAGTGWTTTSGDNTSIYAIVVIEIDN